MLKKTQKQKRNKPHVAIVGQTFCEGCEFSVLDLGEKFLKPVSAAVNLVKLGIIEKNLIKGASYDICFIEGCVIARKNLPRLKELRRVSRLLVVLEGCIHPDGVRGAENWAGRVGAMRNIEIIDNEVALPIGKIIKVDFTISSCLVDGKELLMIVKQILAGRKPFIPQNPVCYECQINGYECLLQKGEICCGPVTLGGCNAVCLKSKRACWGCRGLLEESDVNKFVENCLLNKHGIGEITRVLEIFGVKIDKYLSGNKKS